MSPADIAKLEKHFMSHRYFTPQKCRIPQISLCPSLEALNGFMFGVDATKSLILTLACIERVITVDEAVKRKRRERNSETTFQVKLARLELLFQTDHWGSVEWAHDIEEFDTTARLAAATLFVQLSSTETKTRNKQPQM